MAGVTFIGVNDTVSIDDIPKAYDDLNKITTSSPFYAWAQNQLTGNLDFRRELDMMNQQMAFNAQQAEIERDWSKNMRDTSLTSQYNQAKALGINPYIALGSGGASAPVGATASANGSHRLASGSAISGILSSLVGGAVRLASASMDNRSAELRAAAANDTKLAAADMASARRYSSAAERLSFDINRYNDYRSEHSSKAVEQRRKEQAKKINDYFSNIDYDDL